MSKGGLTRNSIEMQKHLLVAESEINRKLLRRDYHRVLKGVHEATEPWRQIRHLAEATGPIISLINEFRNRTKSNGHHQPWYSKLIHFSLGIWSDLQRVRN